MKKCTKIMALALALTLVLVQGCIIYPQDSETTTRFYGMTPRYNNILTISNNTLQTVSLNRDGDDLGELLPGEIRTIKIRAFANGHSTTITAVSDNPPGISQEVFYLGTYGIQSLPWTIQELQPRRNYR